MTFLPKILFSTILFLVKTYIPNSLPINLEVNPFVTKTTFEKLNNGAIQYGVMGDKTETGDHYVVVVIPEFDEEKFETAASSSTKTLYVEMGNSSFQEDQTISEEVGTMQVYFRRLKDMEGSKEVLAALEKGDSDEFSKELKKRHKGSSFVASVKINLVIDLQRDLLNKMQIDYSKYLVDEKKYRTWEKDNGGVAVTNQLDAIFGDASATPDSAAYTGAISATDSTNGWDQASYGADELFGGSKVRLRTDAVVDSENDADNAYAVGKTFYQNLYVEETDGGDASSMGWSAQPSVLNDGTNTETYGTDDPYSFPLNLKFDLSVKWDAKELGFKITDPNDKNKSLLDLVGNADLEMGEVTKSMEKKYHNLTALWVVIGIVGAALIIGIICACLCC